MWNSDPRNRRPRAARGEDNDWRVALSGVRSAAQGLLQPLPPDKTLAVFRAHIEEQLDSEARFELHGAEGNSQAVLSAERRSLRVPLWCGGPLPDGDGEGEAPADPASAEYHLLLSRDAAAPEFSEADVDRAVVLSALGSLALTRSHCEEALAELDQPSAQRKEDAQVPGMASLEEISGILAHELNNPLTLVLANLGCVRDTLQELRDQLAVDDAGEGSAVARCCDALEVLQEIHGGAVQVREIVRELTMLGRSASQLLSIDEVVRAVLRIGLRALRRRAQVEVKLAPRLPAVRGSAGRLGQVVLNLLLNAVQARPPGVDAEAGEEPLRVTLYAEALRQDGRELVVLRVVDNGPGIPPEVLPRIFESGYTTKAEGSGLGLAISRQIVQAHGGQITVESTPGGGTTVSVLLPAAGLAAGQGKRGRGQTLRSRGPSRGRGGSPSSAH